MQTDPLQLNGQMTATNSKQSRAFKLFLADLAYFYELPRWANEILYTLLMKRDEKGEIILNMGIKKRVAAKLGISVASIKNAISIYHKKQVLLRLEEGIYLANPQLFGKGQGIENRSIQLGVSYDAAGIRQIHISVEKSEPQLYPFPLAQ